MSLEAVVMPAPFGSFTVIADGDTAVASGLTGEVDRLRPWLSDPAAEIHVRDHIGRISEAVGAYFDGDVGAVDSLPTRARGSLVRQRLWADLRLIPAGEVRTYAQLGGGRRMARVAGAACAHNPIPIIVPCHRVVRGDGGLGGFAWDLSMKRWLLDHEAQATRFRARQPVLAGV